MRVFFHACDCPASSRSQAWPFLLLSSPRNPRQKTSSSFLFSFSVLSVLSVQKTLLFNPCQLVLRSEDLLRAVVSAVPSCFSLRIHILLRTRPTMSAIRTWPRGVALSPLCSASSASSASKNSPLQSVPTCTSQQCTALRSSIRRSILFLTTYPYLTPHAAYYECDPHLAPRSGSSSSLSASSASSASKKLSSSIRANLYFAAMHRFAE